MAGRVRPGDGRPLRPFRWWQQLGRGLFHLVLPRVDGGRAAYAVDVRHWRSDENGHVVADLYVDGRHHATSRVPAAFPVPGGVIEVATSSFGLKRCHFVTPEGDEQQLLPDPASAEGRRARLERDHPAVSRAIGAVSVVLLVVGTVLVLLQVAEPIAQIPPVVERFGRFESPVRLPLWLTIALGAGALIAATERALRLRYHWLLDGAAN